MIDSQRMQAVQSPVIPHVAALIRENSGTISLGQGVVHYPPPPQAMQEVANFGSTVPEHHYQAARGLPELQAALREKLAADLYTSSRLALVRRCRRTNKPARFRNHGYCNKHRGNPHNCC